MTHTPLTKADRDSILAASSADGYYAHAISRLCADLDAAEAERDALKRMHDALQGHHNWMHGKLQSILGDEDSVLEVAKKVVAERDALKARLAEAETERDALKKALRLLDRITDGKESSNGTDPEEIQQVVERFVALKAKLADLSEADEELHTCRALVNATSENLSVDLERMVDDLAEANEKAARSEKDSHSWHDLYEDTKAKLAALVEAAARVRIAEDAYEGSEDQSTDYQEVHRSTTDLWAMLDAAIAAARGGAS